MRWDFVYQRPQHLLSRFATNHTVFYVEEFNDSDASDGYSSKDYDNNLKVIVPHLNKHVISSLTTDQRIENVLKQFMYDYDLHEFIFWFYTPMALNYTTVFEPVLTVYDCMDELSNFKFAPPQLAQLEADLFAKADLVFTGGNALYESKKSKHPQVYSFPSSIDKKHFGKARNTQATPTDQQEIPHPRFGFFGVIDERFDIDLIKTVADAKPDWNFILIGPVVKIDPAILPTNKNIYYLGSKSYNELPVYLSGWNVALIPFAINDSTKYISPTKTPEYLAGGKPVISSPITDVIEPYGNLNLVHIVSNADEFIVAADKILTISDTQPWLNNVDDYLKNISWDITMNNMSELINKELIRNNNFSKNINIKECTII